MSSSENSVQIAIVGGGLGGLIAAHILGEKGFQATVFEKKTYPFHRVCGEYISNEVLPFLLKNNLLPENVATSDIRNFELTSIEGKRLKMPLDLGGFGISRWTLDHWLANKLKNKGGDLREGTSVRDIQREQGGFSLLLQDNTTVKAKMVIGAWGKRSTLDGNMQRGYMKRKSPYIGVKYHIRLEYPDDLVALHNFRGGYCGINKIEGDRYNLCYLSKRENLKRVGSIDKMEQLILRENPHLDQIFNEADFLFKKPEVINEISFEKKGAVFRDIPMIGDAAGMITPLCGNGMAISIHASKLLVDTITSHTPGNPLDVEMINKEYTRLWQATFSKRLWVGRQIQSLFGNGRSSNFAVGVGQFTRPVAEYLMSKTHGQPFD